MRRKKKTAPISEDSIHYKYVHKSKHKFYRNHFHPIFVNKDIVLKIRGMKENIHITSNQPLYIGRLSPENDPRVDIDLSRYGGARYGVSRHHALLKLDYKRRLYLTDLESTNGTLLAGRRLKSGIKALVHHGDKIVFGTLAVKIYFK